MRLIIFRYAFAPLLVVASLCFSRTRERAWEFSSGASTGLTDVEKSKIVHPNEDRARLEHALRAFTETNQNSVQFRFSGEQLYPIQISGFRSREYAGRPEEQARAFLAEHRDILGADPGDDALHLLQVRESSSGRHVRFQQRFLGIPVYGTEVTVHLSKRGEVFEVDNRAHARLEWSGPPRINYDRAKTIALQDRRIRDLRLAPEAALVVVPHGTRARPVWKILLAASNPLGDWQVLVDAQQGDVIETRNLLRFADGSGRVFDPNPVVTSRNITLRDVNNSANAVLPESYSIRTLRELDGTGTLTGPYVNTSRTLSRASETSLTFNYSRSDGRFEEVNAYYHIDSIQRYLRSLGFEDLVNRSVPLDVHAERYEDGRTLGDDSYYSVLDGGIYFGNGGVDDAEDGEIIAHEYAHAILNDQIPGIGESRETGALTEGFADFWSASYFMPASGGFQDACIADWDATSYSGESPPCLRRVDRNKHYPEDLQNDPHADGEIWSACLWQILQFLGRDRANRLFLESHFLLSSAADFREGASAILQTNDLIFGGAQQAALREVFISRGILQSFDSNTVPLFSAIARTGAIDAGASTGGMFSPIQYTLVVSSTAARVRIDLEGLDPGDIDLFVRRNQPVEIGPDGVPIADARSQGSGGNETIVLDSATSPRLLPGTYYISLANFSSFPVRYRMLATITPSLVVGEDTVFVNSGELRERFIPPAQGEIRNLDTVQFAFEVQQGTTLLQIDMVSKTPAELDLYARFGAHVQMTSGGSIVADTFSETAGGEEHLYLTRASIPALRPGVYFFAVSTLQSERVEYTFKLTATAVPLNNKLYFPLFLTGREPLLGSEKFLTGIALLNDSGQTAVATFDLQGTDGRKLSDPVQRVLQNGQQFPITVHDLFNLRGFEDRRGWLEVSSNARLKGFFLLFDYEFSRVMDGSDVVDSGSTTLVFPHVERHGSRFNTLISLCNPNPETATVLFQEYNPAGQKVFSESLQIPPHGAIIGGTRGFDRDSGFVKLTSNVPVAGVEYFGDGEKMAALRATPLGTRNVMFYPHFATNRGYRSIMSITNPTEKSGDLLILGFRTDGDLRVLIPRQIGANAQIVAPVDELLNIDPEGRTEIGFLRVQSNALEELVGFTKIDYTEPGGASSSAIPALSTPQRILTFSHVANEVPSGRAGPQGIYTTGITLLAEDTTASYDVLVYDRSGRLIAISDPFVLPKGQKVSKVLAGPDLATAFIGPKLVAGTGYIRVRSNIPIYGFEFFFTQDLFVNCAVPPQ